MAIESFRGEHSFLSNFHPCTVKYSGKRYPSVEHAYQAAKTLDPDEREKIGQAETPAEAKRLGNSERLSRLGKFRTDWETQKLIMMDFLVYQKFMNNYELRERLLNTGNEELIEGNNWGDRFWGKVNGRGKNHLGKILMDVRKDLRNEKSKSAS